MRERKFSGQLSGLSIDRRRRPNVRILHAGSCTLWQHLIGRRDRDQGQLATHAIAGPTRLHTPRSCSSPDADDADGGRSVLRCLRNHDDEGSWKLCMADCTGSGIAGEVFVFRRRFETCACQPRWGRPVFGSKRLPVAVRSPTVGNAAV